MKVGVYMRVANQTNADDDRFKCPWYQGWYENSKFIRMHLEAIKGLGMVYESWVTNMSMKKQRPPNCLV